MKSKILLVEDDAIIALDETEIIQKHGFDVLTAYNGENAIEMVENDPEISLILMDINLGKGIDGTQAAKEILKTHNIPIVFLTSHQEKEYVDKVKKITRYGYVIKNSSEFVLIESINMAYELFDANKKLEYEKEATKKSEQRLKTTLNSIGDAVISTDINGYVVRMNPVAEELCGWNIKSAKGKPLNEIFHIVNGNTTEIVENPFQKILKTKKTVGLANNTVLISKTGEKYQISDSGAPIHDENGDITGVVVVFRDITEKYKQEKAIRDSNEMLNAMFNSSSDGISILDKDLNIIRVNKVMEKWYSYKMPLIGKKCYNCYQNINEPCSPCPSLRCIKSGKREKDIVKGPPTKDNPLQYIELSSYPIKDPKTGEIIGIAEHVRDITKQKVTEFRLKNERQRLDFVLKGTNAGIWEWNIQTGGTIFNEKWANIIGYTLEEISPTSIDTWEKFCHPDDFIKSYNLLQKHFKGEIDYYENELRMKHKNGNWIWVIDSGQVTTWTEDGKPLWMYGTHIDIDEKKKTELALIEKDLMFNNTLKTIPDMISIHDRDMNIIFSNWRGFANIEEEKKNVNTKCYLTYRGYDSICPDCLAKNVFETKKSLHSEVKLPTGLWYEIRVLPIIEKDGRCNLFIEWVRDITNLKKTEEILRESEENLKTVFKAAKNVSFIQTDCNGVDSKIIEFSPGAEEIFGYKREEVIGKKVAMLHLEEDVEKFPDLFKKMSENKTGFSGENKLVRKSGEVFPALFTTYPIFNKDGIMKSALGVTIDITEKKKIEEELIESQKKLHEASRMANLGYWYWDIKTGDVEWSDEVYKIFHLNPDEFTPQIDSIMNLSPWPEENKRDKELIQIAINNHEQGSFEQKFLRPDGSIGYYFSTFQGIYDKDDNLKKIKGTVLDITGRKKTEESLKKLVEEKNLLMKELNHRVKNNLSMVTSLIHLKSSKTCTNKDLSDIQHQIEVIRLVHEKLYQTEDITEINLKDYLSDLLYSIFSSFADKPIDLENRIENIKIKTKQAIPLGMIINEIATNSIKHGFKNNHDAKFSIEMKIDRQNRIYNLMISNNGEPFPDNIDFDKIETLGLRLIFILASQLDGDINILKKPHPKFTIKFPIEK